MVCEVVWERDVMKIAETPIQRSRLYVKESIRYALQIAENDVVEWFVEDGRVYVAKKVKGSNAI